MAAVVTFGSRGRKRGIMGGERREYFAKKWWQMLKIERVGEVFWLTF